MELKRIKDYYNKIQEKFPNVPLNDIKRIMNYGFKQLYLINSYGADTMFRSPDFWCYIGNLKKNPLDHYEYYIKKLIKKIRILYNRKNIEWDGYYYFALNPKQYENYLAQKNTRGRPKKHFKFENVSIFLIEDECRLDQAASRCIFRIKYPFKVGYRIFRKELVTDKAELIEIRNPLKFEDIMVKYNDYDVL